MVCLTPAIPYAFTPFMTAFFKRFHLIAASFLSLGCPILLAQNSTPDGNNPASKTIRVATFNAALYGNQSGQLVSRLRGGKNPQAHKIAAIVQTIRPDILLVNEIDYDEKGLVVKLFGKDYLNVGQRGRAAIEYPYRYAVPSNTGQPSALDIDSNGSTTDPNDAWGYGVYPGQYAMAVYSRFPILESKIRTFQKYRWSQLPDALRPTDPGTGKSYYTDDVWNQLRLSSKNHIDVPIQVGQQVVHLLASHPTPPVFDGADDHNGCRNHDEIRFWTDYLQGPRATHLVDDDGNRGGLADHSLFVIAGDLNSDPETGDSRRAAIQNLLRHEQLQDPKPASAAASELTGTSESRATASFGKNRQMRIDYTLPSREFILNDAGVFWPSKKNGGQDLIDASDHRMVWIDIEFRP